MSLSLAFALLTAAIVMVVFLIVYHVRGLGYAFAAGGLTIVTMSALFLTMVMYITSRMP